MMGASEASAERVLRYSGGRYAVRSTPAFRPSLLVPSHLLDLDHSVTLDEGVELGENLGSIEDGLLDPLGVVRNVLLDEAGKQKSDATSAIGGGHGGSVHELVLLQAPLWNAGDGPSGCDDIDPVHAVGGWPDAAPGKVCSACDERSESQKGLG